MAVSFTPTTVTDPQGAQGSYPLSQAVGHEGMIADCQHYVSRSYRNQSGAAIPFGVFVQTDNAPTSNDPYAVELVSGATGIVGMAIDSYTFEGVSGGNQTYTPNPTNIIADGSDRPGYPDTQTLNVASKGVIWVYSVEAIALGDAVRFYITDYSGTTAGAYQGRFGTTAVASNTVLCTGARFLSETAAAGLVQVEIDLPAMTFTAD